MMKMEQGRPLIGPMKLAVFLALVLIAFPSSTVGSTQPEDRNVSVLYAGSLATVMENGIGPAFTKATGYTYQGEAQGSLGAAQMMRNHMRTPDVFISADPLVNINLLMGPSNQNMVRWFIVIASSQLVLAYNPRSRFAATFEEAAQGKRPWYEILEIPTLRFGRADPNVDPKGYRTLFLFELAAKHYHREEIPRLLGEPLNPVQIFPEVVLMARVESGQFDAGIFYKHEILARQLPYISLPPEINLGDPSFSDLYAQETYSTPSGQHVRGTPILFTVTIPESARHRDAAVAFVKFLLTSDSLLEQFGFGKVEHRVGGDVSQIPVQLRNLTSGVLKP